MTFEQLLVQLRTRGLAACRYEREGHRKFRDCVTVCRNGWLVFQRFSWGEAAGLVFALRAAPPAKDEDIAWNYAATENPGCAEAPRCLTDVQEGVLVFDDLPAKWELVAEYKRLPKELRKIK